MSVLVFAIFALAACGGALAVVLSQNVVRMAFWLIISLIVLNIAFLGSTLIYISGGITIAQWMVARTILGIAFLITGVILGVRVKPNPK